LQEHMNTVKPDFKMLLQFWLVQLLIILRCTASTTLGDAYYGDGKQNEAYVAYKVLSIRQFITKG
jgi:hypothetical protein